METDTITQLRTKMPEILAKQPVMLAYLYGSVVDGNMLPSSDVDIGLVFDPKCELSAYDRTEIEFLIAADVERSCNIREADVRSIDSAPLAVRGGVITEGVLLYSRDEEFRVEYEVHTRKRYFDFLPVIKMMRDSFFRQLQEKGLSDGQAGQG